MSRCNRCTLQDIRRLAARANAFVEVVPVEQSHGPGLHYMPGGFDIFVIYPSDPREKVWAAWVMGFGPRCEC